MTTPYIPQPAFPSVPGSRAATLGLTRRMRLSTDGGEVVAGRIAGTWSDYTAMAMWRADDGSVTVRCAFAVAPPPERAPEVRRLARILSNSVQMGALSLRLKRGKALFTISAPADVKHPERVVERLIRAASASCDMLFPAFLMVCWGGASADDAVRAMTRDCLGEA